MARKAKKSSSRQPSAGAAPAPSAAPAADSALNGSGVIAIDVLSSLVNGYTLTQNPRTLVVPQASVLEKIQLEEISLSGTLLPKQIVNIDPNTNERTARLAGGNGTYTIEKNDGDLHFCVGTDPNAQVHVPCELQNAAGWDAPFNSAVGQPITVSGFFRCLFEHPGFSGTADGHIFEIHPVRTFVLNSQLNTFDVDPPPTLAHSWSQRLNDQDSKVKVEYDAPSDTLTFRNLAGMDTNYVSVSGTVSNVQLNDASTPAAFTFDSQDIGYLIQVFCLQGTSALRQLRALGNGASIQLIALRNINLSHALGGTYSISLLGIDLQATG
jgi:hypothetical protein